MPPLTQPCQLPCQEDCQLSSWTKFSPCTADCVGVRTRKRVLIGEWHVFAVPFSPLGYNLGVLFVSQPPKLVPVHLTLNFNNVKKSTVQVNILKLTCCLQERAKSVTSVKTIRCILWARPSIARATNTTPNQWATGRTASCPRAAAWKANWGWRSKVTSRNAAKDTATKPWPATTRTVALWRTLAATATVGCQCSSLTLLHFQNDISKIKQQANTLA